MSNTDDHLPAPPLSVGNSDRTIAPAIQVILGEQLRAMYGKPEIEPVPDYLIDLLKRLEEPRWDDGK